jgi:four helix bundle protein
MQDFRQLTVWQKSHALALMVYTLTRIFPTEERYGLTSQMRRAAASIPANIAEGCGRSAKAELRQFLYVSFGSASELEYFSMLAHDLCLLPDPAFRKLETNVHEVKRMLTGLLQRVNSSLPSRPHGS